MKRVASTFGQALSLGIAALALATGPTFAFGIPINTPASSVPPVGSQVQPSTPSVNPATVPSDSVPTLVQLPAQYSPQSLDFGTLKGYQNEQRSATITITAPADGTVSAFVQPLMNGPIQVTSMTCSAPAGIGVLRPVVRTTNGNGDLDAHAGDQIEVNVAIRSNARLPSMLSEQVEVVSHRWHVEVPVRAFVLAQPEIVADPPTGEYRIATRHDVHATIRLRRTSFVGGADRDVTITALSLPPGIELKAPPVRVPVNAPWADAKVHFYAAATAPEGWNQTASLRVDTGVDQFTVKLAFQVYPESVTWDYQQQAGDVKVKGSITIHSDGRWVWTAHLHDDGTFLGDDYSVAIRPDVSLFDLIAENGADFPAAQRTGSLGAVAGGSRDADICVGADLERAAGAPAIEASLWLHQHYFELYEAGFTAEVTASTDLTPEMDDFFQTLLLHIPPSYINR